MISQTARSESEKKVTFTMFGLTKPVLPEDFLSAPAPNITVSRIDFKKTDLPEYKDCYAVILDDVLR